MFGFISWNGRANDKCCLVSHAIPFDPIRPPSLPPSNPKLHFPPKLPSKINMRRRTLFSGLFSPWNKRNPERSVNKLTNREKSVKKIDTFFSDCSNFKLAVQKTAGLAAPQLLSKISKQYLWILISFTTFVIFWFPLTWPFRPRFCFFFACWFCQKWTEICDNIATRYIIRHNNCYSGFVKWMKSLHKDYIHDPTFRHSVLVSSSGVIWCWNPWWRQ